MASYEYNDVNLMESMDIYNLDGEQESIFNRVYRYDPIGNLISMYNGENLIAEFDYDPLNRLIEVRDNNYYGKDYSFRYDDVGNILSKEYSDRDNNAFVISYDYGRNSNKLLGLSSRESEISLSYDEAGNLIEPGITVCQCKFVKAIM